MFNINNKNLISFGSGLLVIFALVFTLAPSNANAYFEQLRCEISNFNVSSSYISPGGYVILNWNTNNCNSVNISNIGSVTASGSQNVYPMNTTTYILTAYGSNGNSVYQSRTVTVQKLHCEVPNFNVGSGYINQGGSTTLNWNTNNCSSVNISNIGNVSSSGNQTLSPITTTTYILTAYGPNGESVNRSRTVTVQQLNCEISNFNLSSSYINSGDSTILNWNTNNCNSVNISNIGSVVNAGSQVLYPKSTTTYILTAYGSNGNSVYQAKTVHVTPLPIVKNTTSSSTKNTSKTSGTTSSNTSTKNTNTTNTSNQSNGANGNNGSNEGNNGNNVSELAGNALFGSNGFLPSSLFGWLFFAILILIAIVLWRKIFISDEDRHKPLKHA